jgi:hypothetical protein
MRSYVFAAGLIAVIAAPALADEVGVHVGPVGAGVSVGESHDRDHERATVIKEREPSDRTTVIKKENEEGDRTKTIIHEHKD